MTDDTGMATTTATKVTISGHALDRCAGKRDIPAAAVLAIVTDKLTGFENLGTRHIAVRVFTFESAKGDRHSETDSNGEVLWAIVREGIITTCFYRRKNQPSGKSELQVETVVRG